MHPGSPTFLKIQRVFIAALAAVAALPLIAQEPAAGDWAVGSSTARFTIEVDKGSRPSPLTWTDLNLPNPRWAGITIRVFNDSGQAVGSKILSNVPGEPLILVFDSSSNAQHYDIYFNCADLQPLPLKDDHAGVLLETREGDGKTIDHLPDMLAAWNKATVIEGTAMVPGIFEGGNRFGPQGSAMLHFQAWFDGAPNDHLEFTLMSTDPSYVLVDNKEVVEWPGRHDVGGGMHYEHVGSVDVGPGPHQLDYYNDYVEPPGGAPILATLGVKGGALATWTILKPDNPFLTPSAHAHVIDYTVQGTSAPPLALDWAPKTQSLVSAVATDVGFITLTLTCRPPQDGTVTWTFDDGTTAEGETVDHLFPRPGMRTVQAEVKSPTAAVAPVRQIFHVHPDWSMLNSVQPALAPEAQADILARDPMTFSGFDLAGCAAVFTTYKVTDALLKLEPAMVAKMKDVPDADLAYINEAAALLAPDLTNARASDALLRALVDRCASPATIAVGSPARVELAHLTLLTTDHTDEVKSLLAAVNVTSLTPAEHRAYAMTQADLAVATGDVAGARKQYEALTGNRGGPDARSSVRPTGRIGQARTFLDRKDDESAEDALDEVAEQTPVEKLSPEWALARLRLYQDEKLPDVAYLHALRLLRVITGSERSELLYLITDMAEQRGDKALAGKTLTELLQKHAYSEEAAKAKAKWPGGA
jgi:hypothetical protein